MNLHKVKLPITQPFRGKEKEVESNAPLVHLIRVRVEITVLVFCIEIKRNRYYPMSAFIESI